METHQMISMNERLYAPTCLLKYITSVEYQREVRAILQKPLVTSYMQFPFRGKIYFIAMSYIGRFLSNYSIPAPKSALGYLCIQTRNVDESPSCYFNDDTCSCRGSTYCIQDRVFLCSYEHMIRYMKEEHELVTKDCDEVREREVMRAIKANEEDMRV